MSGFAGIPTPELERRVSAAQRLLKIRDAEQSLLPYAQFVRPSLRYPDDATKTEYLTPDHIRVIAAGLEGLESGKYKNMIIVVPPRHGKSELASRTFIPWCAGRNPGNSYIFATYQDDVAWDFGADVREILRTPQHRQVFPECGIKTNEAAADRIGLTTGGDLYFVGRGGKLTSRGGHGLLLDDPIKDDAEAASELLRNKAWSWFTKTFSTRRMVDDAWILLIQTRWHDDDIVGRLTDKKNPWYSPRMAKQWHIIHLPALATGENDPLGRQEGDPLWPERFGRQYLLDFRSQDPEGFQCLYQGTPVAEDGVFFKTEDLREYMPADRPSVDELHMYMACDYAVGTEKGNDRSAIVVFGVDSASRIWVFNESFVGRVPSNRAVDITVGLIKQFKPLYVWGETGQIDRSLGPFIRQRMREEDAFSALLTIPHNRSKETKAQSIKGRAAQGMLMLPRYAAWYAEVKEELLSFPKGRHDDFVDALALIGLGLDTITTGGPVYSRSRGPAPGTFGALVAQTRDRLPERRYW